MPDPLDYATPQRRKNRWVLLVLLVFCLTALALSVMVFGATHQ
jgi:hypothetical protein